MARLNITLINGYTPPQGDSYEILTFASKTGDFSSESGLYIGGSLGFSPTYSPSTNPTNLNLVVTSEQAGSTTALTSSLTPSTYGQAVTFTANVASTVATNVPLTGAVSFYDGATLLGSEPVDQDVATLTTSSVPAGSEYDRRSIQR